MNLSHQRLQSPLVIMWSSDWNQSKLSLHQKKQQKNLAGLPVESFPLDRQSIDKFADHFFMSN
jgi:hypothetical protein